MVLEVTSALIVTLRNRARESGMEECCGILLGQGERIEVALATANVAPDRRRHFEVDPLALLAAHKAARNGGPQVLGYYHSHPEGLAVPSATDREHSTGDCRVWAIVAGDTVAFWRDTGKGFCELAPRIVPRATGQQEDESISTP